MVYLVDDGLKYRLIGSKIILCVFKFWKSLKEISIEIEVGGEYLASRYSYFKILPLAYELQPRKHTNQK